MAVTLLHTYHRMHMDAQAEESRGGTSDEALFRRFREERCERSLGALIRRHWDRVYTIAWRIVRDPALAEDAAQETFVKLSRLGRYDEQGSLSAFIVRIAVNEARMALRSRRRRASHEAASRGGAGADLQGGGRDPDVAVAVDACLAALEDDLRIPLQLRYADGLTHDEVGAALGLPSGTASSRIRRGLERLRESLAHAGFAILLPELEQGLARLPGPAASPEPPTGSAIAVLAAKAASRSALAAGAGVVAALAVAGAILFGLGRATPAPAGPTSRPQTPIAMAGASTSPAPKESSSSDASSPAETPARDASPSGNDAPAPAPESPAPQKSGGAANPAAAGSLLSGHVISSADETPIAGAEVFLYGSFAWGKVDGVKVGGDVPRKAAIFGTATSDSSGAFHIERAEGQELRPDGTLAISGEKQQPGAFWLVIHRNGWTPEMLPVTKGHLASTKPIIVKLKRGGSVLEGIVVSEQTGAALAGVAVEVEQPFRVPQPFENGPPVFRTRLVSGPGGEFRMDGLAKGEAHVHVPDPRFISREDRRTYQGATVTVPTERPAQVSVVEAARIVVEVNDAAGKPIPSFGAYLEERPYGWDGGCTQTYFADGEKGHAEIAQVLPGVLCALMIETSEVKKGFAATAEPFTCTPGEEHHVRLTVGEKTSVVPPRDEPATPTTSAAAEVSVWRLAGEVLNPKGQLVSGAKIILATKTLKRSVETGPDGRFSFEGLPRGKTWGQLAIMAAGLAPKSMWFVTAPEDLVEMRRVLPPFCVESMGIEVLAQGEGAEHLILRLETVATLAFLVRPPPGVSADSFAAGLSGTVQVAGTVMGKNDRHVAGVEVAPEGSVRVTFRELPVSARLDVALSFAGKNGLLLEDLRADAPPGEVAFPDGEGPTLGGRVLLASGEPHSDAQVVVAVGGLPFATCWGARTDAAGRFQISGLPSGKVTLMIAGGKGSRVLAVDTKGPSDLGDIRLEPPVDRD